MIKNCILNYFDALYLLNIVFKENKNYEFIDTSHVESIWNSIEYKYHKFCVIKAFKYVLGGYEVQIGDEYKGVCDDLIPKEIQILHTIHFSMMVIQILKSHIGREEIMR
jgi:hypothetical protein